MQQQSKKNKRACSRSFSNIPWNISLNSFHKILSLHKADSHCKLNRSYVNHPPTIDTTEAQIVPTKLKYKFFYKGYQVSSNKGKIVVTNALWWLKENSEHYKDMQIKRHIGGGSN